MAKKQEEAKEEPVAFTAPVQKTEEFDFETFECLTLEDYAIYNKNAHRAFREAKKHNPKCDPPIPIKIPPVSLHKHIKIKFQRFDQPENVLKVRCRKNLIDWRGELKPGCTYDLPLPVVRFLNKLSTPIFEEVKVENGGQTKTETKQVGERNRFSCQSLELI